MPDNILTKLFDYLDEEEKNEMKIINDQLENIKNKIVECKINEPKYKKLLDKKYII